VDFEISANLQTERKTRTAKIAPAFSVNKQTKIHHNAAPTNHHQLISHWTCNNKQGRSTMTTMMMDRWGTWWCCHFSCNNMSHCCFVFLQILMTFARQKRLFFFSSSSTANWLCWCLWCKSTNLIMCNCWLSCLSVSFFCHCFCCLLLFDTKNLLVDPLPLCWCCC